MHTYIFSYMYTSSGMEYILALACINEIYFLA